MSSYLPNPESGGRERSHLVYLIRNTPPHKRIAYLALAAGMTLEHVLAWGSVLLSEILSDLEERFGPGGAALGTLKGVPWAEWVATDQNQAKQPFGECFRDADIPADKMLRLWAREVQTIILIGHIDPQSYDGLEKLIRHETWIRGRIRPHVQKSDVDIVLNDAWIRISKVLRTFDPAKGSFRAFAKCWVDFAIRDYKKQKERLARDKQKLAKFWEDLSAGVDARFRDEFYDRLFTALRKVFHGQSPPHELIVFALCLLQWRPGEVWDELADEPLRLLLARIECDVVEQVQWSPVYVHELLSNLRRIVDQGFTVNQTLHCKATQLYYSRACFGDLLKRPVGDTTLKMYCSAPSRKQFSQYFSNWAANVMRRLEEEFFEGFE